MKKYLLLALWLLACTFSISAQSSYPVFPYDKNSVGSSMPSSADFMRTMSRSAARGSVDNAYFNPSGLTYLKDGVYITFGNQMAVTNNPLDANSESKQHFYGLNPDFALVYKRAIGAFHVNTSSYSYSNISGTTWDDNIKQDYNSTNRILETAFGGAFTVINWLSFSIGLRYIYAIAQDETTFFNTEDFKSTMQGGDFSAQFGAHMQFDWFAFSLNYKMRSIINGKLEFKSEDNYANILEYPEQGNGSITMLVPSMLDFGFGFDVPHNITLLTNYTVIFTQEQQIVSPVYDATGATVADGFVAFKDGKVTHSFGIGIEQLIPKHDLTWGTGLKYSSNASPVGQVRHSVIWGGGVKVPMTRDKANILKLGIALPFNLDSERDGKNSNYGVMFNIGFEFFIDAYAKNSKITL